MASEKAQELFDEVLLKAGTDNEALEGLNKMLATHLAQGKLGKLADGLQGAATQLREELDTGAEISLDTLKRVGLQFLSEFQSEKKD